MLALEQRHSKNGHPPLKRWHIGAESFIPRRGFLWTLTARSEESVSKYQFLPTGRSYSQSFRPLGRGFKRSS